MIQTPLQPISLAVALALLSFPAQSEDTEHAVVTLMGYLEHVVR